MPDERGMVIGDRIETRMTKLGEDVAEVRGELRQMDKRLENLERAITQIQWSLVSGFLITITAVLVSRLL